MSKTRTPRPWFVCFLAVALWWLLSAGTLSAQSFTATLTGKVSDPTGAAMPGVSITLTNVKTNQQHTASTDDNGNYTVPRLAPGEYLLVAESPGFHRYEQRGITLEVDRTARIDVALVVGLVTEAMHVTTTPSAINTETSDKSEVITARQVEELPLNGRNYTDLALLVPGIYRRLDGDNGQGLSSSGSRTDASNIILDGVTNRSDRVGAGGITTSVDSIREFKALTSTYSAQYGRTAGAQINVVTKSGTNQFHGSLFEYLRNDLFDARGYFTPEGEDKKLRRNQFGGTLGGPLPFFSCAGGARFSAGRDCTFFFVSYEGTRERRSQTFLTTSPNADWLRGDFSQILGAGPDLIRGNADDVANSNQIFDPANNRAFANNVIPTARFSPVAARMLPFIQPSNLPGTVIGFTAFSGLDNDNKDVFSFKADRRFSQNNNAYVRYARQFSTAFNPFPAQAVGYPGFGNLTERKWHSLAVSDTHAFSPTLVNEARFGFYWEENNIFSENRGSDFNAQLGIPDASPGGLLNGFAQITIDGLTGFGDRSNGPVYFKLTNYQLTDTLTLVRGGGTTVFGADIIRSGFQQAVVDSPRGFFRFRGRATGPRTGNTLAPATAGPRSFADFLLGQPTTARRQVGLLPANLSGYQYGLFVQHDWRARSWLTLNLGLRYELQIPLQEKNHRLSNFVPALGRAVCANEVFNEQGQSICPGDPSFPPGLVTTDKNNFAPRLGFALRPFKNNRTVIRGGGGIFYQLELFDTVRRALAGGYPFVTIENYTVANAAQLSLTLSNPFPPERRILQGLTTPTGLAVDTRTAHLYQYNLTVEHEIARDLAFEIGYVGSLGRRLGRSYNLNQGRPTGIDAAGQLALSPPPFPTFNTIDFQENTASSHYNALQTSLRRRARAGLTLLASYTFARSIDNTSSTRTGNVGTQRAPQNIYNLAAERGLSDFHRKHQFSTSFNYDLPFGAGRALLNKPGLAQSLFGGFGINGIVTVLSGRVFTPQYESPELAQQRPDLVGDPYANIPPGLLFNPAAFRRPVATAAAPDLFGNAGRNILTASGFKSFDFSLLRNFRVTEKVRLQFRAEAFNLFNHPNFREPIFLLDNARVGTLTETANEGRELQFALRLTF